MDALATFLNECRVGKGDPFTHTIKNGTVIPAGTYFIDTDYIDTFYDLYARAVIDNNVPCITEQPAIVAPLRVDFDFKWGIENGRDRKYIKDTILSIVQYYQNALREIVMSQDYEDRILYCIVLEKTGPRSENGIIKDGFHLHFPHFICNPFIQDCVLKEKVTTKMIENCIWDEKGILTPVTEMIDRLGKKTWMMYGSANYKTIYTEPYIYRRDHTKGDLGYAFNHLLHDIELSRIFDEELVGRSAPDNLDVVMYNLSRLLSVRGWKTPVSVISMYSNMGSKARKGPARKINRNRSEDAIMEDIKTLRDGEIMEMLSDDRADEFNSWMDVGWSLFNIGQGCQEALDMWIEFSKRNSKFEDGECEKKWDDMQVRDKSIQSILHMAKKDSPERYHIWKNYHIDNLIISSINCAVNEYDVSKVVLKLYGDKFVCADSKKGLWYEFQKHRWVPMDDSVKLEKLIVDGVIKTYQNFLDRHPDDADSVGKIIAKLKTIAFVKKVVAMCKLDLHDNKMISKLNKNKMLFGCENGVLDLELGIFRDGRPDDYMTFSCGQNYTEYAPDDTDILELNDYLTKIFPNIDRREFHLDFYSSCLQGGNVHKIFRINTGAGDNGKSVDMTLIEKVFGDYCKTFPPELFIESSRGNSSGAARPELARAEGARIMRFDEIAGGKTIDIGVLKLLTGGDKVFSRSLYSTGEDIAFQFILVLSCNKVPNIPEEDATWDRTKIVDYESRFVKPRDIADYPVPDSLDEQLKMKRFRADPNFTDKIEGISCALLYILFERYKAKKGKLSVPDIVNMATKRRRREHDIYIKFIESCLQKIDSPDASTMYTSHTEIYTEYNGWYRENYPSMLKEKVGSDTLRAELSKRLGTRGDSNSIGYEKRQLFGYTIIREEYCQ